MSLRQPGTSEISQKDYCLKPLNSKVMVQNWRFTWRDSQDSNQAMMIHQIREKIPRKPLAKIKELKE